MARIGVIGTGDVGLRLATGFHGIGHEVMIGSRDPKREELVSWQKSTGARASLGTNAEAARWADVVVLATAWSGTENAVRLLGAENVRGKIVVDVTNPLQFEKEGAPPRLAVSGNDSGGETVQRWLPEARVVKALNTVTNSVMVNPSLTGGEPTLMICGNDEAAKREVGELLKPFGWTDVMDFGGIELARHLESMVILWVHHAFRHGQLTHAFKLLR